MSYKTHNTVEFQVTSLEVMDSSTRNIILGVVFGVLAAVIVLAIIYYYCTNKKRTDKETEEAVTVSPFPERVSAATFTKNMGATQTTVLDIDGYICCLDSQEYVSSADKQESNITTTPDMFKNSKNFDKCRAETSVRPVDLTSKEMSPVTLSVSALGVNIPESVNVDIPESTETSKVVISPPGPIPPTESVFKQPKQNSMSLSVLSRTMSFLRRNQVDGSLSTDTYFQSSFSNIEILQENNIVKDQDELTSSSERLKNLLEKDEDELEVGKDEGRKDRYSKVDNVSDSVFLPATFDEPLEKITSKNDDNAALVSPCTLETCASVQSVSELVSPCTVGTPASVQSVSELVSPCTVGTHASVQSVSEPLTNQTSASFSFEALGKSPEEVKKELDWDSSHEPLETRTSVLKLVCTPNPSKNKWQDVSSSSEDSPEKLSCVVEGLDAPRDEGCEDETQTELEWDHDDQYATNLTSSFHETLSNLQIGKKSNHTPRKSSNSSFTSAMSMGRTPLHRRLRNSCAYYETAEEDM